MSLTSFDRYEQIQKLAYERYLARGCKDGYDLEDWLAAEQEVFGDSPEGQKSFEPMEIFENRDAPLGDLREDTLRYREG